MDAPLVSVVIPSHNPDRRRLDRVLDALQRQTLQTDAWECVVVDNASDAAIPRDLDGARVVSEPAIGLSNARRRGFQETRGALCVLVDDDNLLAADYLENVARFFEANPTVGALGGRILPEFEETPPAWVREFDGLLALRDHGSAVQVSDPDARTLPEFAPVGAGMAARRTALQTWLSENSSGSPVILDRTAKDLASGGDNDILLTMLADGWRVAYSPDLVLHHLLPTGRTRPEYLARLNRSIQESWIAVLAKHRIRPWSPVRRWTLPLRQARAWWRHRAWSSHAAYIRWQGACGHFAGRARLT